MRLEYLISCLRQLELVITLRRIKYHIRQIVVRSSFRIGHRLQLHDLLALPPGTIFLSFSAFECLIHFFFENTLVLRLRLYSVAVARGAD